MLGLLSFIKREDPKRRFRNIFFYTVRGMILIIKHIGMEGPESLGRFFEDKGFSLLTVNLHEGEGLPGDLSQLEAVVSLGGPMNVYEEDRYPFLKEEDLFLRRVVKEGLPFLGICLGAQLLCKAAGGRIARSPEEEIGWFNIGLTSAGLRDVLFHGIPERWEVFQWHGDMCVPPSSAPVLAGSVGCPVQAFRIRERAYGLQFHAEITDKSINDWSLADRRSDREDMLAHYARVKDEFGRRGRTLCENFLEIMKKR